MSEITTIKIQKKTRDKLSNLPLPAKMTYDQIILFLIKIAEGYNNVKE